MSFFSETVKMAKRSSNESSYNTGAENKKIKTESCTDQSTCINYMAIPSLQKIAAISVVVSIWRQPDLIDLMYESSLFTNGPYHFYEQDEDFDDVVNTAMERLSELPLPNKLKKYLSSSVNAIGLQIAKRLSKKENDVDESVDDINSLDWTAVGTINEAKLYKRWFEEIDLYDKDYENFKENYITACNNCAESEISRIWQHMPVGVNRYFLYEYDYDNYDEHLVAYWTFYLTNRLMSLNSVIKAKDVDDLYNLGCGVYVNMISLLIRQGSSLSLFPHFWSELSIGEIEDNITKWTILAMRNRSVYLDEYQSYDKRTDILCFLMSQFTDVKKLELVFQEDCTVILQALFMNWPWQDFLLPTVRTFMYCFDKKHYIEFMGVVVEYLIRNKDVEGVLKELWDISSLEMKKGVITERFIGGVSQFFNIVHLFYIESIDFFNTILDNADAKEMKKIVFAAGRSDTLYWLCYNDKLHMLDIVFQRSSLSESQIRSHKKHIGIYRIRELLQHSSAICSRPDVGFSDWEDVWEVVEKLLYWCFSTRQQIYDFKQNINELEIAHSMIMSSNYPLLEKFTSWLFQTESELIEFKGNFLTEKGRCVLIDTCRKGDWLTFKMFIEWCSASNTKTEEFKDSIVKDQALITELLWNSSGMELQGTFVDSLLLLCLDTRNQVIRYKRKFITSFSSLELFDALIKRHYLDTVKKLINWYNPLTKSVVERFKVKFKCKEESLGEFVNFGYIRRLISRCLSNVIGPITPRYLHPVGINRHRFPYNTGRYKFL